MKADRFTGPLLIHCHLPPDSDEGMMMVIEVVEKGELRISIRENLEVPLSSALINNPPSVKGICKRTARKYIRIHPSVGVHSVGNL